MEIVLGILILLAICSSRAAKNGLTLIVGIPLGLVAAIMLLGLIGAGISWVNTPIPEPVRLRPIVTAPPAPPSSLETFLRTTNEDLAEMSHALNAVSRMRRTHGEQARP